MAKIKNKGAYPLDIRLTGEEYLVGTDPKTNKKTKNYSLKDIAKYSLANSDIEGIDQDNFIVNINAGEVGEDSDNQNEVDAINSLDEFEVTEKQIPVIESFEIEYKKTLNYSSESPSQILSITTRKHALKVGKGFYGISINNPTYEVEAEDLELLYENTISIPSSSNSKPKLYHLTNPNRLLGHSAINASGVYVVDAAIDTYFKIDNVLGIDTIYRFVGAAGTYGLNNTQSQASDLLQLNQLGIETSPTTDINIIEFPSMMITAVKSKADLINEMPVVRKTANDIFIFNFREAFSITSGVQSTTQIEYSSWFLKRGKGLYGSGFQTQGNIVSEGDLKLNFKENGSVVDGVKIVMYYSLDTEPEQNIVNAINNTNIDIEVNSSAYITLVEKNKTIYEIIGADGTYGKNKLQVTSVDLEELDRVNIESLRIKEEIEVNIPNLLDEENIFTEKNTFEKEVIAEDLISETLDVTTIDAETINAIEVNTTNFNITNIAVDDIELDTATIKDLLVLKSIISIPINPEVGTIVNQNKGLHYFDGTNWHKLDMTIHGI